MIKRKVKFIALNIRRIDEGDTKNGAEINFFISAGLESISIREKFIKNGDTIEIDKESVLEIEDTEEMQILCGGYEDDGSILGKDRLAGAGIVLTPENNFGVSSSNKIKHGLVGSNKHGEYVLWFEIYKI